MKGVSSLTHVQPRMAPDGRVGSRASTTTGESRTSTDETITNSRLTTVSRLAKRRGHERYNEPWASGYPPRIAPATYQIFVSSTVFPNSVMRLSTAVPAP